MEDGYFIIEGRKNAMILGADGYNIYTRRDFIEYRHDNLAAYKVNDRVPYELSHTTAGKIFDESFLTRIWSATKIARQLSGMFQRKGDRDVVF